MSIAVDCNPRYRWPWRKPRRQGRARGRAVGPANRVDTRRVASPSPDVARANFAAWVRRTLTAAYRRGLKVRDIEAMTGVSSTTWDRWRAGEYRGMPQLDKVTAFANGLDVPLRPALQALGLDGSAPAAPEPELDPDLRPIARRLADPNTPPAEVEAIRNMLRLIAAQSDTSRGRRRAG